MAKDYRIDTVPRMFEQVAKELLLYIQSENLQPGAKLLPERTLSEKLQVSRSSIREGLRLLELLKYIESRQGEGTFVRNALPFVLPALELKQELPSEQLNHYFGIASMIAEKIIMMSFDSGLPADEMIFPEGSPTTFWSAFGKLIYSLAAKLENPFYAAMWNSVYDVLEQNEYFGQLPDPIDVQQFRTVLARNNPEEIKRLLQFLANH